MSKRVICPILLLCLLLSGCAGNDVPVVPEGDTVDIYYVTDWESNHYNDDLLTVLPLVPNEDDLISFCLNQLFAAPSEEGLLSPFPPGVKSRPHTLRDGLLTLKLSEEYAALTGFRKTLAEACLTLTLCALPNVSEVMVLVGGETYPAQGNNCFTAASFSLDALILKPVEQSLTLYFVDTGVWELVPEVRWVTIRENEPMEYYVLEALWSGPRSAGLSSALPNDTPLPAVSIDDGICYVNFPAHFYQLVPPFTHGFAIQAITRSLMTSLSDIHTVQFRSDGQLVDYYGNVPLDELMR